MKRVLILLGVVLILVSVLAIGCAPKPEATPAPKAIQPTFLPATLT